MTNNVENSEQPQAHFATSDQLNNNDYSSSSTPCTEATLVVSNETNSIAAKQLHHHHVVVTSPQQELDNTTSTGLSEHSKIEELSSTTITPTDENNNNNNNSHHSHSPHSHHQQGMGIINRLHYSQGNHSAPPMLSIPPLKRHYHRYQQHFSQQQQQQQQPHASAESEGPVSTITPTAVDAAPSTVITPTVVGVSSDDKGSPASSHQQHQQHQHGAHYHSQITHSEQQQQHVGHHHYGHYHRHHHHPHQQQQQHSHAHYPLSATSSSPPYTYDNNSHPHLQQHKHLSSGGEMMTPTSVNHNSNSSSDSRFDENDDENDENDEEEEDEMMDDGMMMMDDMEDQYSPVSPASASHSGLMMMLGSHMGAGSAVGVGGGHSGIHTMVGGIHHLGDKRPPRKKNWLKGDPSCVVCHRKGSDGVSFQRNYTTGSILEVYRLCFGDHSIEDGILCASCYAKCYAYRKKNNMNIKKLHNKKLKEGQLMMGVCAATAGVNGTSMIGSAPGTPISTGSIGFGHPGTASPGNGMVVAGPDGTVMMLSGDSPSIVKSEEKTSNISTCVCCSKQGKHTYKYSSYAADYQKLYPDVTEISEDSMVCHGCYRKCFKMRQSKMENGNETISPCNTPTTLSPRTPFSAVPLAMSANTTTSIAHHFEHPSSASTVLIDSSRSSFGGNEKDFVPPSHSVSTTPVTPTAASVVVFAGSSSEREATNNVSTPSTPLPMDGATERRVSGNVGNNVELNNNSDDAVSMTKASSNSSVDSDPAKAGEKCVLCKLRLHPQFNYLYASNADEYKAMCPDVKNDSNSGHVCPACYRKLRNFKKRNGMLKTSDSASKKRRTSGTPDAQNLSDEEPQSKRSRRSSGQSSTGQQQQAPRNGESVLALFEIRDKSLSNNNNTSEQTDLVTSFRQSVDSQSTHSELLRVAEEILNKFCDQNMISESKRISHLTMVEQDKWGRELHVGFLEDDCFDEFPIEPKTRFAIYLL